MIALIVFSSIAGWILISLTVGRMSYNHYIEVAYRKELKEIKNGRTSLSFIKDTYNLETIEEYALQNSKEHSMADINGTFIGLFWPFGIFWLIAVKLKSWKRFSIFFKSKVEREVEASVTRVSQYNTLLKIIKESKAEGIDTRELEQLAKSYKS
jgi:hypothetical protein